MKISTFIQLCMNVLFISFLFLANGCTKKYPSIEGEVLDFISLRPITNILIKASTKTDIKEELKNANKEVSTSKNGKFTLSGLLPNKLYSLKGKGKDYTLIPITIMTPEVGQTKILQSPLLGFSTHSNQIELNTELKYIIIESDLSENEIKIMLSNRLSNNSMLYKSDNNRYHIFSKQIDSPIIREIFHDNADILLDFDMFASNIQNYPSKALLYRINCKPELFSEIYNKLGFYLIENGATRVIILVTHNRDVIDIITNKKIDINILPKGCVIRTSIEVNKVL